jgi:hypothetical protein
MDGRTTRRRVTRIDQLSARQKSKITNGNALLDCDGRSAAAKRYRDIAQAIVQDQQGAGDRCAEARLQLIRRFAGCSILAEALEAKLADGENINIAEYTALASALVRISARIGINRAPEALPTMDEFLASRRGAGFTEPELDDADEEELVPSAPPEAEMIAE